MDPRLKSQDLDLRGLMDTDITKPNPSRVHPNYTP